MWPTWRCFPPIRAGVVADLAPDDVELGVLLLGEERHHHDRLLTGQLRVHHRPVHRKDGTEARAHARGVVLEEFGLDHLAVADDSEGSHAPAVTPGSTFWTSSCGRGIRCAAPSSPVFFAAVAPAP